jgi:hypothetical protein
VQLAAARGAVVVVHMMVVCGEARHGAQHKVTIGLAKVSLAR